MKQILRITLGLIYLASMLFALIVLVKPGAAIFFSKSQIKMGDVNRDGDALEYRFRVNTHFFDPSTLMILEDQKKLEHVQYNPSVPVGAGIYSIKKVDASGITVRFVPATPSHDTADGHTYWAYIRPYLFSSNCGGIGFLLLLLGMIAFIGFCVLNPARRQVLLRSPFGVVQLWLYLFDWPMGKTASGGLIIPAVPRVDLVKNATVNIFLVAYFYTFMEWVFFVTKPSFMDILSLGEKVKVFFISGLAAALLSLLSLPAIFLFDVILTPTSSSFRKYLYSLPAAFLGACLSLVLIDNFTYIVFQFGIVYSKTLVRVLYALIFLGIFAYFLWKMAVSTKSGLNRNNVVAILVLVVPSLAFAGFTIAPGSSAFSLATPSSGANKRPNIILLGTDGLNAENMSVYGYERDTTPFITELAKTSLLSENNFSNAAHSMGSDTAMLTGKLPFETRVLYNPNTLTGSDRYQHLPGILKREGYRTVSLGVPYYVDVNIINFINGFDAVNCQENITDNFTRSLSGYGVDDVIYLFSTIEGRIQDRLGHIFFLKDMVNPFTLVTQNISTLITEQQRLDCLHFYLDEAKKTGQPLFAHVHLMGTHGGKFTPDVRVFSKGQDQDQDWMTDFYDDAILTFDFEVQRLVSHLRDQGLYENTILVLYTDHGQKYVVDKKLPLIIHFPNDQYAGTVKENTQNLDIAPTLLDYMGIPNPSWMDGSSLLRPVDPKRLIFAAYARGAVKISGEFALSTKLLQPPFYQFGSISIIQCQNVHNIDLVKMTSRTSVVAGYRNPCPPDTLDAPEVIREKAGSLMMGFGYQLPGNW